MECCFIHMFKIWPSPKLLKWGLRNNFKLLFRRLWFSKHCVWNSALHIKQIKQLLPSKFILLLIYEIVKPCWGWDICSPLCLFSPYFLIPSWSEDIKGKNKNKSTKWIESPTQSSTLFFYIPIIFRSKGSRTMVRSSRIVICLNDWDVFLSGHFLLHHSWAFKTVIHPFLYVTVKMTPVHLYAEDRDCSIL